MIFCGNKANPSSFDINFIFGQGSVCLALYSVPRGGETCHICIWRGVTPKNFQATQKYQFSFIATEKYQLILWHVILGNLCMNMIGHETMQIKVRIGSKEPRNVSLITLDAKQYHEHNFRFIWIRKYHFRYYSSPDISDLPPCISMC